MRISKQHSGWTKIGILGVLISSLLGGYAADFILGAAFVDPEKFNPFLIGSLFLTPMTVCMPLIWRVFELKSSTRLSASEKRRIDPLIKEKIRQYGYAIAFYILGFLVTVVTLGIIIKPSALFSAALVVLGGLMGISIFTIYLLIVEYLHIEDFKSTLENRAQAKKTRRATLERLTPRKSPE